MHYIIYLTGAPASGKSSLTRKLKLLDKNILVFEYGKELTKIAKRKHDSIKSQTDLRSRSANVITPDDVSKLDENLIKLVNKWRNKRTIIIDSHAVTKENYGYRITGFSTDHLISLKPDKIFVLYSNSDIIIDRISKKSGGRPLVNKFEADFHTFLQGNVAVFYGLTLGIPVYFFDSSEPSEVLVKNIWDRLI